MLFRSSVFHDCSQSLKVRTILLWGNTLAMSELPRLCEERVLLLPLNLVGKLPKLKTGGKETSGEISVPFPITAPSSGSRLISQTNCIECYQLLVGCVFLNSKLIHACAKIGAVKCCLLKTKLIKTCPKSNRLSASSFIEENQF